MNFCGNCGTNIPEGSPFCPTCGAPAPAPENQPAGGKKMDIKKLIIAGVAVVVAVVLCIVLFTSCSSGPEKVVDDYLTAMFKEFNVEEAMETCLHEDVIEEAKDQAGDSYDMMIDALQEQFDDIEEAMEEEDGSIDWDIKEVDDMKKSKLEDYEEMYEDEFDLEVTDGKIVEVEVVFSSDDDEKEEDIELEVIKVDGDWYIASTDAFTSIG